jgi:hypothetical protein
VLGEGEVELEREKKEEWQVQNDFLCGEFAK